MTTKNISIIVLAFLIISIGAFYMGKNTKEVYQNTGTPTIASTTEQASEIETPSPINNTSNTSPIKPSKPAANNGVALTTGSTAGFNTYSNATYNFSIKYPKYVQARPLFSTFHELGSNWRMYAGQANQGKPVASFSIFSVDHGSISTKDTSYPLFFSAEVRVGVSPNVKECYATDAGYADQKVTNVTINGIAFKKFSASDAAMMKYVQVESYRTIHNNMCYAIEQIKNGSSYRDEVMKPGIADTTLQNYYNEGLTIIKTFKFTK